MGYFLTTEPENAPLANSLASPKTHTPGSRLQKRGYRYYMPEVGRWCSRDPAEELGGLNQFSFLENDPLNGGDLLGLVDFVTNPARYFRWNRVGARGGIAGVTGAVRTPLGDINNIDYKETPGCCWTCKMKPFENWWRVVVSQVLPRGVDDASERIVNPVIQHEMRRHTIYEWSSSILQAGEQLIRDSEAAGLTKQDCKLKLQGRVNCIIGSSQVHYDDQVSKWQGIISDEVQEMFTVEGNVTRISFSNIRMPHSLSDSEWNPVIDESCSPNSTTCPRRQ